MAKLQIRRAAPDSSTPAATSPAKPATPAAKTTATSPEITADPTPRHYSVSTFRLRRGLLSLTVLGVLGFWLYHANAPASQPQATLTQAVAPGAVADPEATIQSVLTQGETYETAHGSFTGFNPSEPRGVLVGAAGPGMVVSVHSGTTCLYSGIISGTVKPVLSDSSLSACSASLVASAKATLQSETNADKADQRATLGSTASQVENTLSTWSLASGGTFANVTSSLRIAGTAVLSRSATRVVVKITSGSSCEVLTVPSSAQQTPTTTSC
jgi:hypothetical protein